MTKFGAGRGNPARRGLNRGRGREAKNGGDLSPEAIADLYDSAIDDARWPDMARLIAKVSGLDGAGIWLVEGGQVTDISITMTDSILPYVSHYHKFDPWARGILTVPEGRAMVGSEYVSEPDLLKSEFYNDFARRFGLRRPLGARLQLAPRRVAMVAMEQPATKKLFELDDRQRMQPLLPHLKGALQLRARNRQNLRQTDVRGAALDALAFGAIVCDAAGQVSFVNAAARALEQAGAGIVLGGRRRGLGAVVAAESLALVALVRDAASGGPGGVLRLRDRKGAVGLLVLVTPLPGSLRGELGGGHALVALRPPQESATFTAATVATMFGLSPTQASIALAIFEGKSPEQIAIERGVRMPTLRTHLSRIFAQTGAENQRDLVRLLGMLPPLRGEGR
jgi:DNA-binding CsgD family transcriptional regulator